MLQTPVMIRGMALRSSVIATWRQVMLRFLQDPEHFNGLRRLAEVPNYPDEKSQ
jgi:hypothetical protein